MIEMVAYIRDRGTVYMLTAKGRAYVVENKLV